ncbi:hypothetical protein LTR27_000470 [Elasticomyces elasticus]|nr:hypothetical protein LTR27_000470 [Elasticomyces elasticus]
MSKTLRAGLAWATPVKPDQLIIHLATYKLTLPALTTIRLAHRFGTGPQVHITRLPVEILLLIEDIIVEAQRKEYYDDEKMMSHPEDIESDFACFESKCEPRHHWVEEDNLWDYADTAVDCKSCEKESIEGTYSKLNCDLRCTKHTAEPCGTCVDGEMGAHGCERNCYAKWKDAVNKYAQETDHNWEFHDERKDAWLARIDKSKQGAFLPYKTMLKQHFGLEVYLANTVVDGGNEEQWPKHKNYRWHPKSERQTTLCYLTLPKRQSGKGNFKARADYDYPTNVDAAQAVEVDMRSLSITDEQRRRFQRALKTLGLEVYLHPSQAHAYTVTPDLSLEEDSDEESDTNGIKFYLSTSDVPS